MNANSLPNVNSLPPSRISALVQPLATLAPDEAPSSYGSNCSLLDLPVRPLLTVSNTTYGVDGTPLTPENFPAFQRCCGPDRSIVIFGEGCSGFCDWQPTAEELEGRPDGDTLWTPPGMEDLYNCTRAAIASGGQGYFVGTVGWGDRLSMSQSLPSEDVDEDDEDGDGLRPPTDPVGESEEAREAAAAADEEDDGGDTSAASRPVLRKMPLLVCSLMIALAGGVVAM